MVNKMKKIFRITAIIFLIASYFNVGLVSALVSKPILLSQQDTDIYTFADLGVESDIIMKGPYESTTIRFELPPTWELQDGSEINLVVESYFSTTSDEAQPSIVSTNTSALLEVYFNGNLQQSIPLISNTGASTYRIPISVSDLGIPDDDGYYSITLALDASVDCDLEFHKTTVVIGSNSYGYFPHFEKPLELDLRKLPWPLYQERAKSTGSSLVVVPTNASVDEIQSALVVMGTLGRMSQGRLLVSMTTIDQLTDTARLDSDLIFVGKSTELNNFFVGLPNAPVVNGQFSIAEVGQDDGVLQILPSPWNPSKSLLLVGGTSDIGVVKAAQALSTNNLQTGITPDYSVIAQVNPVPVANAASQEGVNSPDDILLSNLGYQVTTVDELGINYLSYEFIVPQGQVPSENPYVEIKYSNSVLVDPARSFMSVFLNGIVIGSIDFSDEDASLVSERIEMPASLLKFGVNILDLEINLIPRDECSVLSFSGLWTTVYEDSLIHLPLVQNPDAANLLQDLKAYPYPFANDPSLATTTFIVPQDNLLAWSSAGKVAFDLGARINGSLISFETAFDNLIPESSRLGNFIVVGEPKNLAVLEEMQEVMPAYFEPGSNVAILESQLVVYRVSDQKSLGYLEVFASPWNAQSAVLGIFGTNTEGITFALNSLLNFQIRETLSGNFSTYDGGNRAIVVDTRTGYGIGGFESNLGDGNVIVVTPSATAEAPGTTNIPARNSALVLIAIAVVALGIAVVVFIALRFRNKIS